MNEVILFNTKTPVSYSAKFIEPSETFDEGRFTVIGKNIVNKPKSPFLGQEMVKFQIGDNPKIKLMMLGQVIGAFESSECNLDIWGSKGRATDKEFNPKLKAKIEKGNLIFLS